MVTKPWTPESLLSAKIKPIRADYLFEGYKAIGMCLLFRAPSAFLSEADRVFIFGGLDFAKYLPPAIPLSEVVKYL